MLRITAAKGTDSSNCRCLLIYISKKLLRVSPEEHPRKCRAGPIITCTIGQVGRLSSVSLLPTSGYEPGGLQSADSRSASLIRDVGLMGREASKSSTHTAGTCTFTFLGEAARYDSRIMRLRHYIFILRWRIHVPFCGHTDLYARNTELIPRPRRQKAAP